MKDGPGPYGLPEAGPVEDVRAGSTVLVTGPAGRATRRFVLELVCHGHQVDEGTLLVSPDRRTGELFADCRRAVETFDPTLCGVVDCTGRYQQNDSRQAGAVHPVSSPEDLTGIGIGLASLVDGFADAGHGRIRTALLSLSTLLMYAEFGTVLRFVHTVTGRISTTGGLGVLALDPDTADDRTVSTLAQLCDGRIDVRQSATGDRQMQVWGLGESVGSRRSRAIDEE